MLYKHLNKEFKTEDSYICTEDELRKDLYEQALDDLEDNIENYFEEIGPFQLSKMLDIFKIAIYGSVEDVIKTFEKVWGDTIIIIEEDSEEENCPYCNTKQEV